MSARRIGEGAAIGAGALGSSIVAALRATEMDKTWQTWAMALTPFVINALYAGVRWGVDEHARQREENVRQKRAEEEAAALRQLQVEEAAAVDARRQERKSQWQGILGAVAPLRTQANVTPEQRVVIEGLFLKLQQTFFSDCIDFAAAMDEAMKIVGVYVEPATAETVGNRKGPTSSPESPATATSGSGHMPVAASNSTAAIGKHGKGRKRRANLPHPQIPTSTQKYDQIS